MIKYRQSSWFIFQDLKKFGMNPLPGVQLTVLSRDLHTPYSGMLPGLVAGFYEFDDAHVDLRPLCQFAGARLVHAEAIGLEPERRRIICEARPPIEYDLLSINIGSRQVTNQVPGVKEFATAVKPINRFMASWTDITERVIAYPGKRRIGVVGAGAAGVEIILAMQRRLQDLLRERNRNAGEISFHLISKSARILPTFDAGVSRRFERILARRNIDLRAGVEVVQAGSDRVVLSSGEPLELDEILWVTEGGSQPWLSEAGLAVDEQGFVKVHETLQSVSHANIFAAGDIAHVEAHPRPKAGVIAVRQGPPLAENLRRVLQGKKLKPFKPQGDMLALISTGDRYAIASRGRWHTEGAWVWRWKDWIDRRWMRKYHELPEMPEQITNTTLFLNDPGDLESMANHAMRCMGCGAKVPPDILNRVLRDLSPILRPEVVAGIHAPDDAALVKVPSSGLSVHTVDHLSAIVNDPYIFGQIAATHALSDIYAMGAEPRTALAILTIPHATPAKVETTVRELMAGTLEVLNAAGTALIGGHTAEGPELSVGFSINGHIDDEQALTKQGIVENDVLVLTKPLGIGTIFAADMRGKAKGRWVEETIETMLQSNKFAADIFCLHGAHACTDVTGFGLLGHLVEMCGSSSAVELNLASIPVLPGAIELSAKQIFSSLFAENKRHFGSSVGESAATSHKHFPLLFDPQTSGGLLAAIPAEGAARCIEQLTDAGYRQAAVIGRAVSFEPGLPTITLTADP
ncbi:MAG: selenide, water dikinase SelD [Gammaproteobacteria bacterium]